jgi:PleD family two-component response regulator
VSITLSGGIASFPLNASSAKDLLNAADQAMYSAKAAGKNTVVCFKGMMNEKNI